jgi:hypothetical protein
LRQVLQLFLSRLPWGRRHVPCRRIFLPVWVSTSAPYNNLEKQGLKIDNYCCADAHHCRPLNVLEMKDRKRLMSQARPV